MEGASPPSDADRPSHPARRRRNPLHRADFRNRHRRFLQPKNIRESGYNEQHEQLLATMAIGFVKTVFILIVTLLLNRVRRGRLLLSSVGGMIVSLVTLGISLTIILIWAVVLSFTLVLSFVATFSNRMGPITNVHGSEIFPLRLQAQEMSIVISVNRVMSGVVMMTFIPLSLYKAITIGGDSFLFVGVAMGWFSFICCSLKHKVKLLRKCRHCLVCSLNGGHDERTGEE